MEYFSFCRSILHVNVYLHPEFISNIRKLVWSTLGMLFYSKIAQEIIECKKAELVCRDNNEALSTNKQDQY